MGAFAKPELKLRVWFDKGSGEMAKKQNVPSYIHTNMALLALQRAMNGIQLINDNIRLAELHWYEAHGVGRRKMKIKRFLD